MIRRNYLKSLMIFILTCLPLLGASAQQKVTVNVVNASLKQVFSTIENQTSYRFSYKSDIIDHRKDITIRKSGVFDKSKLFYPTPQTELNSNSLAK